MSYQNNTRKYVAVLNGKYSDQIGLLLNALGHATAGLVFEGAAGQNFQQYENEPAHLSASISEFPFNVLKSKNGNQLRTLHEALLEAEIPYNVFVKQMIGASAEEQIINTRSAPVDQLEYLALVTYGDAELLAPMTKKFSLYK
ncbi:DUF2000 family protein [Parvibaculaceae bacterium PLY_AMNH_Bact1]|nr:DUF2000 family protein [Parvibaculaceae bacterium PLY_AMNH_Bact1]